VQPHLLVLLERVLFAVIMAISTYSYSSVLFAHMQSEDVGVAI
jgi:hypothetical protein